MRGPGLLALAALALVVCALAGCAADEVERFDVRVTVASDEGQLLEAVPVRVDDVPVGQTDANGQLLVALPGPEGRRVTVAVQAPPGFRGGLATRSLVLDRLLRRADGTRAPLEVATEFAPLQRSYVLLVDVGQPGLPVQIFGEDKAITNSEGAAVLTVAGVPGDDLQVRVTRGGRADLRPDFVAHSFTLPDHAGVCVVDGRFTQLRRPPPRAHHPTRL